MRDCFLIIILLVPGILPAAATNAAQQAARLQSSDLGQPASSVRPDQAAETGGGGAEETRITKPTGSPALHLTWESRETHVGVPTLLTIQAVDAEGQPDARVNGTVQIDFEDLYAQVYQATVNPVAVNALEPDQLSGR